MTGPSKASSKKVESTIVSCLYFKYYIVYKVFKDILPDFMKGVLKIFKS